MRILWVLVLSILLMVPASAQAAMDEPWRASVTGQIEALRSADGETALSFAGAAFRANYRSNPQRFVDDVARSGYGPIGQSRSHSFGASRELAPGVVLQEVEFIDADGRVDLGQHEADLHRGLLERLFARLHLGGGVCG